MNVGYCTNIHSGASFSEVLENLSRFAVPVKEQVYPGEPMGIGLWFSATALQQTLKEGNWQRLRDFLAQNQLVPHTFNAFPFSDFHEPVVKHRVYNPDWSCPSRMDYTFDAGTLMSRLLPTGSQGSISTLPLGWPTQELRSAEHRRACADHLSRCANQFVRIRDENGINIRLCVEPEPGCLLDTGADVVRFFNENLFCDPRAESSLRQHLGVCHDICHSAVMFESQQEVLSLYRQHDIQIGKVQISSAVETVFEETASDNERYQALSKFAEPRYLHQTSCRSADNILMFFEDLPAALKYRQEEPASGHWRTHFHVPVHLENVGALKTTRQDIFRCLQWFQDRNYDTHFEIETYAWQVSPQSIRGGSMIDSIAAELKWLVGEFPGLPRLNRHRF